MTLPTILISGPSGTGKTTIAKSISCFARYKTVNVGDALCLRLNKTPSARENIGPMFLDCFGIEGYTALIRNLVKPGTVIDGIRSAQVIGSLRRIDSNIIVIHCLPRSHAAIKDAYIDWVMPAVVSADEVLPWVTGSYGSELKAIMTIKLLARRLARKTTNNYMHPTYSSLPLFIGG